MEILKIFLLDKIESKFGNQIFYSYDLKNFLSKAHRIPKEIVMDIISELIRLKYITKEGSRYKLKKGLRQEIEITLEKIHLRRNRIILS